MLGPDADHLSRLCRDPYTRSASKLSDLSSWWSVEAFPHPGGSDACGDYGGLCPGSGPEPHASHLLLRECFQSLLRPHLLGLLLVDSDAYPGLSCSLTLPSGYRVEPLLRAYPSQQR